MNKQDVISYLRARQAAHRAKRNDLLRELDAARKNPDIVSERARILIAADIEEKFAIILELDHIIIAIQQGIK